MERRFSCLSGVSTHRHMPLTNQHLSGWHAQGDAGRQRHRLHVFRLFSVLITAQQSIMCFEMKAGSPPLVPFLSFALRGLVGTLSPAHAHWLLIYSVCAERV